LDRKNESWYLRVRYHVDRSLRRCDRIAFWNPCGMNIWRYETRESLEIDAPVERVFAVASDPQMVPMYAPEVTRIEILDSDRPTRARVHSHLKIAGLTFTFLYRYHYRAPAHYSGMQMSGLLRGYFSLRFGATANGASVTHTEGIVSRFPLLAPAAGFLYYRLLARGGMRDELYRLKTLIEGTN
jgi:hypothetical protein